MCFFIWTFFSALMYILTPRYPKKCYPDFLIFTSFFGLCVTNHGVVELLLFCYYYLASILLCHYMLLCCAVQTCQCAITWDFFKKENKNSPNSPRGGLSLHTPLCTHLSVFSPLCARCMLCDKTHSCFRDWNWRWQPKACLIRNDEEMMEKLWHKNAKKMHLKAH